MQWLLEAGPFSARDGEDRTLFDDAELKLPVEAAVVLDGPSGSGKTTLLRHLVGLESTAGTTRSLNGEQFVAGALQRWRSRVTLLAQDAPMLPGTVRDNLELPFRLKEAPSDSLDLDRAQQLLAAVGLQRLAADRDVAKLSGGERHRLALARGLLWNPPVLLADEPLSGLDPDSAAACFDLLLEFAHAPGHALLCVLHHRQLGDAADHRLHLADGRLEVA